MVSTLEPVLVGKTLHMAKDKKPERKSPRLPVQMPKAWIEVARKLATDRRQPMTWLIVSLIEEAAKKAKLEDLPPLPWEHSEDD